MKMLAPLLTVALLAACAQEAGNIETATAPAETTTAPTAPAAGSDPQSMGMSDAEHQDMGMDGDMGGTTGDAAGTTATATGTIESVDAEGGKITIDHGPVDALKWPAMTMGFSATPEQIQSVQSGQKVEFEFMSQGSTNTLTRITPAQ